MEAELISGHVSGQASVHVSIAPSISESTGLCKLVSECEFKCGKNATQKSPTSSELQARAVRLSGDMSLLKLPATLAVSARSEA